MTRRRQGCRLLLVSGFAWAASTAAADMPAVNHYWVHTEALARAASSLPSAEVAAFETALQRTVVPDRKPPSRLGPGFRALSENDLLDAVVKLVKPHLGAAGEIERAKVFLAAVGRSRCIRGTLVARDGGDFVTSFELVSGKDGVVVLRQRNAPVAPLGWKGTTFDLALR